MSIGCPLFGAGQYFGGVESEIFCIVFPFHLRLKYSPSVKCDSAHISKIIKTYFERLHFSFLLHQSGSLCILSNTNC